MCKPSVRMSTKCSLHYSSIGRSIEESRGAHTRSDFPKKDKKWIRNIITELGEDGNMKFGVKPVDEMPGEYKNYVKPEVYS